MLCPECGSDRLRPSRPQGAVESTLRRLTRSRYHVCSVCSTRSRLPRRKGESSDKDKGVDVTFWVAVALLGAGFVALLVWVN